MWFGWIHYPKNLELKWDTPQRINKVVLYDRPTLAEHMAACVLTFSDGSKVDIYAVPNDGSAKTVVFEPRTVTSLKLDVVDGVGEQIGLSEIEVYYDPTAQPEAGRSKTYYGLRVLRGPDHRDRARPLVLLHARQPTVRHGLCLGLYAQQEPRRRRIQLQQHGDSRIRQHSRLDHVRHQHHADHGRGESEPWRERVEIEFFARHRND